MDGDTLSRQPAWWVTLLAGLAAIVFGIAMFVSPARTLTVLVVVLGVYWIIRGILTLVGVFTGNHQLWGWRLFAGIIAILAGLFVVGAPLVGALIVATVYAIVLGIQAILAGVAYIYTGAKGGGGGEVAIGIFDVIAGIVLVALSPVAAALLPVWLGILLIIGGIGLIAVSLAVRRNQSVPHGLAPA